MGEDRRERDERGRSIDARHRRRRSRSRSRERHRDRDRRDRRPSPRRDHRRERSPARHRRRDDTAPRDGDARQHPGMHLPVRGFSDEIVRTVKESRVSVLIGETGSGKTTQLSQILLDAGLVADGTMVAVTQPRRVAAVTVARRVAEERGTHVGGEVGYAVRFEDRTSGATRIKYLTDGTLMREVMLDPELSRYSVVVLDEAHERSLNTDILFGLLKGLVATRKAPLRLVVTSATLDGEKFCKYFGACPMITVPGRVHPVEVLHSTEKPKDYADAAVETAMDIHCDCGEGDILVFLTGQHEIEKACRKLRALVEATPEGAAGPVVPLPLYAALPPDAQARVFAPAPPGVRRCIFATNIAETSVTVDGVVYVVDAGMSKQKRYDAATGMDALDVELISRVQATQRAGRAGRTRPGKCFRLYPEKTFEREMPAATSPEIQRMSLVGAALYLKSLPLDIDLLAFDFLDRPTDAQWHDALRQLYALEAIDARGRITPVGKQMAALPVGPSLARALIAALDLGCLDEMVAVAAMLSADNVFLGSRGPDVRARPAGDSRGGFATDGGREVLQGLIAEKQGDHVLLLRLWEAWASHGFAQAYVKDLGLDPRGMKAARDVHRQLRTIVGHDGTRLREMLAQGRRHEAPPGRDGTRRTGGGASRETSPSQWSDHTRFTRDTRDTRDSDGGGMRRDASVHSQLHKQQQQQQQQPVGTQERGTFSGNVRAVRRAVCLGFANKLAKRAPLHNGYRTVGDRGQLAQLHPGCCTVEEDERGLLPSWVVYHEHVAGQRCHLTTVSPVEDDWVADILPRLRDVDVRMLSGGETTQKAQEEAAAQERAAEAQRAEQAKRRNTGETVDAARARYLARKQARGK